VLGKESLYIEYVQRQMEFDGVSLFTDEHINADHVEQIKSKYKVGWLREPYCLHPQTYERALTNMHKFDAILTYYQPFLDMSDKFQFCPYGGIWIPRDRWGMHSKSNTVSFLLGGKRSADGHIMRHQVAEALDANNYHPHYYGIRGASVDYSWETKVRTLESYYFSIVTETCKEENEFTEWLLDCFIQGTVPVFWGCPNVAEFFDPSGIIAFDAPGDVVSVFPKLCEEYYLSMLPGIANNFLLAQQYEVTDDWFYENVLVAGGYIDA
jgi:hypothetical protein